MEVSSIRRRSVDSLVAIDGGRSAVQPPPQQQPTPTHNTRSARECNVAGDVQAALLSRNQSRMEVKDDDLQDALDFFANSAGGFPTRARESSNAGLNAGSYMHPVV
jgi:hypothetical protein